MKLEARGSEDYNLEEGEVIIELSRGIEPLKNKPVWRVWAIKVNHHMLTNFGPGKIITNKRLVRELEEGRDD